MDYSTRIWYVDPHQWSRLVLDFVLDTIHFQQEMTAIHVQEVKIPWSLTHIIGVYIVSSPFLIPPNLWEQFHS